MSEHAIQLQKGREQSIERKHPWIFSGAIKSQSSSINDGDTVVVNDYKGNFLCKGQYSNGSIAVRILSFDDVPLDQTFWSSTLQNAYDYRVNHLGFPNEQTNAFRLIHGEGDLLPGLVIDVYNDVAVVQCHSAGMYKNISLIKQACLDLNLKPIKHIFTKNQESLKGNESEDGWLTDLKEMPITIKENNKHFLVNVETGQKTGFFLDQRDNRALVGEISNEKTVLNLFCYTGGFSIYALAQNAKKVVSIDVSKTAMDIVDINVGLLPNASNHESRCLNIMEYLKVDDGEVFDVVVVDPPAFAKSVAKRHNAIQAYKRLNAMALQKVKPGGIMLTFSCSQVVTTQLFYDTIVAAAIESNRKVKVMKHLSQGADHPVNLYHPEGHYLKGLMLAID